jgi:predicted transcriptional regulator
MDKKTVTMPWEEHQEILKRSKEHREEMEKAGEYMAAQEKIMEELIKERSDIVVIERHRICVDEDYRKPNLNLYDLNRHPDGRHVNFPRFLSTDAVAKELDQAFMDLRQEILDLKTKVSELKDEKINYIHKFRRENYTIPNYVFESFSWSLQKKIINSKREYKKS